MFGGNRAHVFGCVCVHEYVSVYVYLSVPILSCILLDLSTFNIVCTFVTAGFPTHSFVYHYQHSLPHTDSLSLALTLTLSLSLSLSQQSILF